MNRSHTHSHAFANLQPREREGLTVVSRRNLLKAGLAGLAGLSVPKLLQHRAEAGQSGRVDAGPRSIILLWMAGGPSQIDTWDPKPDRPPENRGPFGTTPTKIPGVRICEHLPKMAAMLDQFTLIRSVDARQSNHEPNTVFQTGNLDAETRTNPEARNYPAIASIIAKMHGPNRPNVPPYVAFTRSHSHLAFAGYLGKPYDPFIANDATKLPAYTVTGENTGRVGGGAMFELPAGLTQDRVQSRRSLLEDFDRLQKRLDTFPQWAAFDKYERQAVEMLAGGRIREALDSSREPVAVRDRYGKHLWCQQALLARRLVEAGVAFVTLDLSYHPASGTWDTHGDNIPPYGGIRNGLGPLLPLFDHLITTLVSDLKDRGLLEQTLILAMGEFGRTPQVGTQGSSDGRNHWPYIMSMALAGGGLRHGQVIGKSSKDGGQIEDRPITPCDLAATLYRYMGVPLDGTYLDPTSRPRFIVEHGGQPIRELF
jgi:hypothetical protein